MQCRGFCSRERQGRGLNGGGTGDGRRSIFICGCPHSDKGAVSAVCSFFEQLLSAPDYEACIRLLREKGWEGGQNDWEEMLSRERQKTWKLMEELLGDTSVFDVFYTPTTTAI